MSLRGEVLQEIRTSLLEELEYAGWLPADPEDLVGEVILRLMVANAEIRCPHAYARQVLRNLINDLIKKYALLQQALQELARARPGIVEGNREARDLENEDFLERALEDAGLSCLQKRVIPMIYREGMTISEVAREISKNPGTILKHRDRAIEKMARWAAGRRV